MKPPIRISFYFGRRKLAVGPVPLVVGTLCSLARPFPPPGGKPGCDVVEVRLDKTGRPPQWMDRCKEIQERGWPVLLTLRLKSEGGAWVEPDAQRFKIFEQAIQELAGVDIEWRSKIVHPVAMYAKLKRKVCVISYHDFEKTPPAAELASIIRAAADMASIVKIATRLRSAKDEETLVAMLGLKWKRPLCVIGLGPEWSRTRVSFPKLGSCLTYGYLDKPAAPGQTPADELTRQMRETLAPSVNTEQGKETCD
jgi:3-dehydroquinate dehydratase-1